MRQMLTNRQWYCTRTILISLYGYDKNRVCLRVVHFRFSQLSQLGWERIPEEYHLAYIRIINCHFHFTNSITEQKPTRHFLSETNAKWEMKTRNKNKWKSSLVWHTITYGDILICNLIYFLSKYIQSYFTISSISGWVRGRGLVCATFAARRIQMCQDCWAWGYPSQYSTAYVLWKKHLSAVNVLRHVYNHSIVKLYHYENTPIQTYCKFYHQKKNENFEMKNSDNFYVSAQNTDCGYSLEPPRGGGSNDYPQSMFWSEIRKIMFTPVNPSFTI